MNDSKAEILLIDDDRTTRTILRVILTQAHYVVIEASDALAGIELYQRRSPSLILLDALMPEIDGFECCRRIRELPNGKDTPILMVTALEDQSSVDKAFIAGASDFVTKPVKASILLGRMENILKSAQATQALRDSEEKYRSLVTSLQEVILQINSDGEITFINPVWHKLMGYSLRETLGQNFENFLHPVERSRYRAKFKQALEYTHQHFRSQSRCLTKEGQIRWVEMQICANVNSEGQVLDLAARLRDVTEQARYEKYCRLEYTVNRILSNVFDTKKAIRRVLQAICGSLELAIGEYWSLNTITQNLSCEIRWNLKSQSNDFLAKIPHSIFIDEEMESVYDIHAFIEESRQNPQFPKESKCTVVNSFVVVHGQETLGLVLLWGYKKIPVRDDLFRMLNMLGQQVGQYLKRKAAEEALMLQNERLRIELQQAAKYVESLLPHPEQNLVSLIVGDRHQYDPQIKTLFKPSNALGGDVFDYIKLDEDNLMFYLLDVAGHGVKAALLSVSVLNIIRKQGLQTTDFYQPELVLKSLNNLFQMNDMGDDYFTIWYGVYNLSSRLLTSVSAGHPPGLLVFPEGDQYQVKRLNVNNIAIGLLPEFPFESRTDYIPKGSSLFIYSDGAYEFYVNDRKEIFGIDNWQELLLTYKEAETAEISSLFDEINCLNYDENLEDDCSVLEVIFN